MKMASSDHDVDVIVEEEIYKDEYVSVYFGLTIWWRKKQGSQGTHYTLCITHYTLCIAYYTLYIAYYT